VAKIQDWAVDNLGTARDNFNSLPRVRVTSAIFSDPAFMSLYK